MKQLKPCFNPECENDFYQRGMGDWSEEEFYVECPQCGCRGPVCDNEEEAIGGWNSIQRREDYLEMIARLSSRIVLGLKDVK